MGSGMSVCGAQAGRSSASRMAGNEAPRWPERYLIGGAVIARPEWFLDGLNGQDGRGAADILPPELATVVSPAASADQRAAAAGAVPVVGRRPADRRHHPAARGRPGRRAQLTGPLTARHQRRRTSSAQPPVRRAPRPASSVRDALLVSSTSAVTAACPRSLSTPSVRPSSARARPRRR